MKKYITLLSLLCLSSGLQAQVASSAVSQGDLNFLAGTIYIEMNFPSARMAMSEDVKGELVIFPNPVTDILYFQTKDTIGKAYVYDMGGRIIIESTVVDNTVDVRQLQAGSYIIVIEGTSSQGQVFLKK